MILNESQINLLNTAIGLALNEVYEKDIYLIQNKVHERTIVSRFCIYFQQALNSIDFASYNLDFEYSKNHSDPKRTENFPHGTYPDVILHSRGSNDANVLIIEFKTWWESNTATDIKKLKDFTIQQGQYKYGIGYSIVLYSSRIDVQKTVIINGEIYND